MSPLVTVVIPAFNRPGRLEEAIRSVLEQTFRDFLLVVVDDASTRDLTASRSLVEGSGHRWIRLPENAGPSAARNAGAALTETPWLSFLDSDDLWYPEKLERQLRWHDGNPRFRLSQVTDTWSRNGESFPKPGHLRPPAGWIFPVSVDRCAVGPSCVCVSRILWEETGGFDERFRVCEDYELWLRITHREPVGLVPGEPLAEKRGGWEDQLSTTTRAMDTFRLAALVKLLSTTELDPEQRETAEAGIRKRARLLAQGAAKRNRNEWHAFYSRLDREHPEVGEHIVEKALAYGALSNEAPET